MPPLNSNFPYVVTVHDLIHLRFGSGLQRTYYDRVIRSLLKKSACVLTVSEYSKNEIISWSGLSTGRVVSIYNGVSEGFVCEGGRYNPGFEYLLYVGNKRKHKNLKRLLIAFSQADLSEDIKLVLTGDATKELHRLAQELKITDRVKYVGHVPEEDLPSLYRGALAVILVSLYEGFGIPVIEAMACCSPVLASNCSALPEICADAAYMIDPTCVNDISAGIEQIVNEKMLRKGLIEKGKVRSSKFNWNDSAGQVWQIFSNIIND